MRYLFIALISMAAGVVIGKYALKNAVAPVGVISKPSPAACNDIEGVDSKTFMEAVKRYGIERLPLCNNYLSINQARYPGTEAKDARSIWFPLDTIKAYICTIEKYSSLIGLPSSKLGVNMFYCVYDEKHKQNSGRHTIYMTPTFDDANNNHIYFDPRITFNEDRNSANAVTILELLNRINSGASPSTMLSLGGSESLTRNSGQLCPPCNQDFFDKVDRR
jgi:hypothetical protein